MCRLVPIAREGEDALRRLAEAHGLAPAAALEQLVELVLVDEAVIARRMLRNPGSRASAFGCFRCERGKSAA